MHISETKIARDSYKKNVHDIKKSSSPPQKKLPISHEPGPVTVCAENARLQGMLSSGGQRNNNQLPPVGEMRELNAEDDEDESWAEREASRTHSVKFSDEQQPAEPADKEVSPLLAPMLTLTLTATTANATTRSYYRSCADALSGCLGLCMRPSAHQQ